MTRLSEVCAIRFPEGDASVIKVNGETIWRRIRASYVSLGDSIAAGHTINEDWGTDYGEGSQYGKNGNASTVIVPNSYTDLARDYLTAAYGEKRVTATSFARSGDTVADLMEKLSHDAVRNAISKADLVTVCIGANDVLQPALMDVDVYIETGDLSNAEAVIEANMTRLATDADPNSYASLLNELESINPDAKFAFTTIYNPYKYLWIDEGRNGFFAPLLSTIPDMNILGFDVDGLIKDGLLSTSVVQMLFDRVNGLCDWAEYRVNKLNDVIRGKVNAKRTDNPNFSIAEVKAAFDVVPDRPTSAEYHYNDLVSVEFTRGYDTAQMDWGALWRGSNAASFWVDLATDYVSLSGFDINGFASDLVTQIVEKVIVPDIDPHPEPYGHFVIVRAFEDALT